MSGVWVPPAIVRASIEHLCKGGEAGVGEAEV